MDEIVIKPNEDGIIYTKDIVTSGISKYKLYKYVKENNFEQIFHGIYVPYSAIVDRSYLISQRCTCAIVSHDEALFYHRLIEREPIKTTITVYSGYNTQRLKNSNVKIYYIKKELLDIGKIYVMNDFGHCVPMYDLERTICDVIRNRNDFEIQDFQTILKNYSHRVDKDLNKLYYYGSLFKIEKIIRLYMGVLL